MINIQHTYTTFVEIIFYPQGDGGCGRRCFHAGHSRHHPQGDGGCGLHESTCGSMDEIAEHCCEILIKHNFAGADVCDAETGEVLMTLNRSL